MEEVQENIMPSTSSSELDFLHMEFCANCCECLGPASRNAVKSGNSSSDSDNVDRFRIARCLSSIFKLNYLSAFIDPPSSPPPQTSSQATATKLKPAEEELSLIWNGDLNLKLCDNCSSVFTNLWKYYEDFIQLTNLESRLSQQIEQLGICIENCKVSRANSNKQSSSSTPAGQGPFIVLQRLEADSDAQRAIALSNESKTSGRKTRSARKSTKVKVNVKDESMSDLSDTAVGSPDRDEGVFDEKYDAKYETDEEDSDGYDEGFEPNVKKGSASKEKNYGNKAIKSKAKKKKKNRLKSKAEDWRVERVKRDKLERHYKRRKLKVANPCWLCELDFQSPEELYDHTMKQHFQSDNIICKDCSYIASTKLIFRAHERKCKSLMPGQILPRFPCDQCSRSFSTKQNLRVHIDNLHQEREPLHCGVDGCKFVTKCPLSLQAHNRGQHNPINEPEEVRTCHDCNRVFKSKHTYNIHRFSTHTVEGARKYKEYQEKSVKKKREERQQKAATRTTKCLECEVDFFTLMALICHQRKFHPSSLPFVCESCGASFSGRSTFTKHMKHVHSNARQYVCSFCGKAFKTSGNLHDHIKHTHDEQGRLEYNAKMRLKNQRRKIREQALAQNLSMEGQPLPTT